MNFQKVKKANHVLIFCALVLAGLVYGASFLIPLSFAVFFATLILPVVAFLEKRTGAGRLLSSFVGTFLVFLGVGLLFFFLINELARFLQDIIERREDILNYFRVMQENLAAQTGFSMEQQEQMFMDSLADIINVLQNYLSGILTNLVGTLLSFLLTLVFVFLFLVNRDKMVKFIMMYSPKEKQPEVQEVIGETTKVAHKYLWGRIKVMSALALMYVIAFLAFDLPHIGLLVIFGALITIIPFIGPFISGLLPILFMIGFGGTYNEILLFTGVIVIIQLVESYVLEPLIIGSEIHQSPLFVIIAVLLGGVVWGPAGFVLFVPIFAIIKIIFDHIPSLHPVAFLMGYERPETENE